jgi:hypothetical protein
VGHEQRIWRRIRTVYVKQELGHDKELPTKRTFVFKGFEDRRFSEHPRDPAASAKGEDRTRPFRPPNRDLDAAAAKGKR